MNKPEGAIIVSGGTRGLGLEIVRHCLDRGWQVATFARSTSEAVQQLQKQSGARLYFERLDLADTGALSQFAERVDKNCQGIYALVNNAAIGQDHLLAQLPEEEIHRLLAVDLAGPICLTRAVVRQLLLNNRPGRILNISSICAQRGFAGLSVYAAAKGGLESFTRALARELGPRQILVNAIAPGFFASEMSQSLSPQQMASITKRTPSGRLTEPSDLWPWIDLLLFGDTNMTGQIITVDGGASV
jgi:3-oxoacyl-[acyl-carrier protein] reductase